MTAGVETTTGPLGQGLATAVGMAMAERMLAAEFGKKVVDHHTYVLASDGDLMEGISQEAIALAGHLKLNKLIVLWDDNGISIDGPLSIADSVDQVAALQGLRLARRARSTGTIPRRSRPRSAARRNPSKPTLIACKTMIGFGAPKKAGTSKAHGEPLGAEELAGAKEKLGITGGAFEVAGRRAEGLARLRRRRRRRAMPTGRARFGALRQRKRAEFERRLRHARARPSSARRSSPTRRRCSPAPQTVATRKASEIGARGDRAGDAGAGRWARPI